MLCIAVLAAGAAGAAAAQGPATPAANRVAPDNSALNDLRAEFRLTYEAVGIGIGPPAEADSAALRRYTLYPYLERARIERALLETSADFDALDERARRFIAQHEGEPVAQALHRSWLRSLADRERWDTFVTAYRPDLASARMRCEYLAAKIAFDDIDGIAAEIESQWLAPTQQPSQCEPVFQWLRDAGLLSEELVEQRVRALLANGQTGFGRVIARRLTAERARPLLAWADLLEQPAQTLDDWLANGFPNIEEQALLEGWFRFARNSPTAAHDRAERLLATDATTQSAASRLALSLALGLAWDRQSQAIDWFARTAVEDFDDDALAWLARAALWSGQWRLVADSIESMSAEERATSAWRYWQARAEEQIGDKRSAREIYAGLLPDDNYYAVMAAIRLQRTPAPHQQNLPADNELTVAIAADPVFIRVRELIAVDLRSEATLEWQYGYAALNGAAREQSVHVAAGLGLHDIAVATATRHAVFDDYNLLYPRPYDSAVTRAAELSRLQSHLLYAVIRQESLYRSDAASGRDALGLMQLRPGTARRTARDAQLPPPQRSDLFEPDINVMLGALNLNALLERFDGQLAVALAGYNAGPEAAQRWLPERSIDSDIWIENIPYNETRAYVRRVMWHRLVFEWLETARVETLDDWLAPVVMPAD
jgi:soluble lytic murein transglycosylase